MVDYAPNIPQGTDNLSVSQGQIQNNFTQLNNIFDFDHYTWDDPTTANRGLHRQVTFPAVLGSDPAVSGDTGELYTKTISAVTELFFANATDALQLTNLPITTSGSDRGITTPWGLIINFGTANVNNTGPVTTFAIPFNSVYCCVLTPNNAGGIAGSVSALGNTTFRGWSTAGSGSGYYIAIGV